MACGHCEKLEEKTCPHNTIPLPQEVNLLILKCNITQISKNRTSKTASKVKKLFSTKYQSFTKKSRKNEQTISIKFLF